MRTGPQFAGQPQAAGTEQGRQRTDLAVRRQGHLHPAIEGGVIERRTTLLGASENAVLAEHGEDFTRHESIEMHDAAIGDLHPFRMTARQADQQIVAAIRWQVLQHAQHLCFFAAHHIR
ncbi:hypothetical protein D3C84_869170 [compost metagenome]